MDKLHHLDSNDKQKNSTKGRYAQWDRALRREAFNLYKSFRAQGFTQRQSAQMAGVPRSTIQHWLWDEATLDIPEDLARFAGSSYGDEWLHSLFIISILWNENRGGKRLAAGLRHLKLDRLFSCSEESLRRFHRKIEAQGVRFGEIEQKILGAQVEPRDITVCADENFIGGVTLVMMEPVSGYLFNETLAPDRKAQTWGEAASKGVEDLPFKIVQVVSDEGSSLLSWTEEISASHSPDLFHVEQEVCRGAFGTLRSKQSQKKRLVKKAKKRLEEAKKKLDKAQKGRKAEYKEEIREAKAELKAAKEEEKELKRIVKKVKNVVKGISAAYHLVSLRTGKARDKAEMKRLLESRFARLYEILDPFKPNEKALEKLAKAEKVLPKMLESVGFVNSYIQDKVDQLRLSKEGKDIIYHLISESYLKRVAKTQQNKAGKRPFIELATDIREKVDKSAFFEELTEREKDDLTRKAQDFSDMFQRSSSCVEGRNGAIAFQYHGSRKLSPSRRAFLTAQHNFDKTREDGTTAAQRLFGIEHRNFREFIEKNTSPLPRPRKPPRKNMTG